MWEMSAMTKSSSYQIDGGHGVVSRVSQKLPTLSLSPFRSEYGVVGEICLFLGGLLSNLGSFPHHGSPPSSHASKLVVSHV